MPIELKFYEFDDGDMIMCSDCLDEYKKETEQGKYKDDPENGWNEGRSFKSTLRPEQCDICLVHSDNYDEILVDE